MKMLDEHYQTLNTAISTFINDKHCPHGGGWREWYKDQGLSDKRYRWDLLWAAGKTDLLPEDFVTKTLYPYLNDDHIDTALRKIVEDFYAQAPNGVVIDADVLEGLRTEGVEQAVLDALNIACGHSGVDTTAHAYAHGMARAYREYGLPGVKMNVAYLLGNLGRWQGDAAREAKKILKKWSAK